MKAPFLGISSQTVPFSFERGIDLSAAIMGDDLENPLYTGRYFVIFDDTRENYGKVISSLNKSLNMKVAVSSDFRTQTYSEDKIADADAYLYEHLGIALISAASDEIQMIEEVIGYNQVRIEPELVVYAIPFEEGQANDEGPTVGTSASATWGVSATAADLSSFTGQNVKVAILDTGLDLQHPDFAGRVNAAGQMSFVSGVSNVQDMHGHGTHCTGIACGNADTSGVRYGVAGKSEVNIIKVLDNNGRGAQSWAINGIDWASANQCKVISMSLGSRVFAGISYITAYERSAANAVANGSLIVAAAGNDSKRGNGIISPVSSPGNCPSVIAITALDNLGKIGDFANSSINPSQSVYMGAPGVDIYSSWTMPQRYRSISGTSMATPYISGICALLWEKFPTYNPMQIKAELCKLAKKYPNLPLVDIGCGSGIAP